MIVKKNTEKEQNVSVSPDYCLLSWHLWVFRRTRLWKKKEKSHSLLLYHHFCLIFCAELNGDSNLICSALSSPPQLFRRLPPTFQPSREKFLYDDIQLHSRCLNKDILCVCRGYFCAFKKFSGIKVWYNDTVCTLMCPREVKAAETKNKSTVCFSSTFVINASTLIQMRTQSPKNNLSF